MGERSNAVVRFAVRNRPGHKPELVFNIAGAGKEPLVVDMDKLAPEIVEHAAIHGLKQRVSDAAAMSRDTKTGASASPREKYDNMAAIVEHLNSGTREWRMKGGERIGSDESLLARALAQVYPNRDAAKLRAYVAGLTKPERAKLLATGDIKVAAELIREQELANVTANVDADKLLEQLEEMD